LQETRHIVGRVRKENVNFMEKLQKNPVFSLTETKILRYNQAVKIARIEILNCNFWSIYVAKPVFN